MTREQKIVAFLKALQGDNQNLRETYLAIAIVLNELFSISENLESLTEGISAIVNRDIRS
jgi:hypothetical protein